MTTPKLTADDFSIWTHTDYAGARWRLVYASRNKHDAQNRLELERRSIRRGRVALFLTRNMREGVLDDDARTLNVGPLLIEYEAARYPRRKA